MELHSQTSPTMTSTSAPTTPAKKGVDLNARALNLLLEQIFLLSLRKDATSPLKIVESGDDTLLTTKNLNDIVIMYLSSGEEANGAISYLVSCFRRLLQKESTISEKLREDFQRFVQ